MSANKTGTALLVDLAKGFALSEFYPHKHPSLVQGILKLDVALQARPEDARVEVHPTGLSLAGEGLTHRSPHVERFAARLGEHEIRSVVLRRDMGSESVGRFLSACTLPPRVARAAGGFHAVLAAAGAAKVAVNGSWVEPASQAPPSRPASASGDSGISLWSAHDAYEQVQFSARRVATEDTAELRRMLHEGNDSERLEALQRLEFVAQHHMQRGDVDRVVALVDELRRDAEKLHGRDAATRGAVMLAMHRIAEHAVVNELVARLGKARSEDERVGLRSTLLHLGAEVVTPLVRELTAASDLSARRALRDTLVALDSLGVPLLEDMIGDQRWFVVRNMVGILGEIRSADAAEHFARTLLHDDARVRRETILALSKYGDERAVPLLVKALTDREASLRAAAALGLGLYALGRGAEHFLVRLSRIGYPTGKILRYIEDDP
ncbi:MAG: HEAT repeat domain-containing protein, partial [Gemmatimonadetes bacterium]|nr:HEAT repeat domain-containing protein [Gemmatimonadota bacterium]